MHWTFLVVTLHVWCAVSGDIPFIPTDHDEQTFVQNKILFPAEIIELKQMMTEMKQEVKGIKDDVTEVQESLEAGFEHTYSLMKELLGEGMPDLKTTAKKAIFNLQEAVLSNLSSLSEDVDDLRGEYRDGLEDKINALNSTLIKALVNMAKQSSKPYVAGNFSCDNSEFLNVPQGLDVCGEVVSQGQCGKNTWYLYHCCRSCQAAGMVPDGALPINRAWIRTVDYSRG